MFWNISSQHETQVLSISSTRKLNLRNVCLKIMFVIHPSIHTGVKNIRCNIHAKDVTSLSGLRTFVKIHNRDKSFSGEKLACASIKLCPLLHLRLHTTESWTWQLWERILSYFQILESIDTLTILIETLFVQSQIVLNEDETQNSDVRVVV